MASASACPRKKEQNICRTATEQFSGVSCVASLGNANLSQDVAKQVLTCQTSGCSRHFKHLMCTKHISKLANFICKAVAQIWNFGHAYSGRLREAFLENMVNHILIWRWGHPLALAFRHGSGEVGGIRIGFRDELDSNGLFVEALMTETHFAHEVWGLRCMPSRAFTSFDSSTWANQATHGRHCNKWRTYRKAQQQQQQQQQQHPSSVSAHWKSKNGLTKSLKLGLFSCKILKFGQKLLDKSCLDKSFWASNLCWFYRRPG